MNTKQKNIILAPLNFIYNIRPDWALKILFRLKAGYSLNLKTPKGYNEKLQWIKLYYKNPLMPKLVDKYTVREYIHERSPEILTSLLWQGFDAKDIPWNDLPLKFVIKATHGSGFNIICTNKNELNRNDVCEKLNSWLKEPFLKCYGEWFYGVEKPRIIIEEFLDNETGNPPEDYKIFCFDGVAKYIVVDTDRYIKHKRNIYDLNWNFLSGTKMNFDNDVPMDKPKQLDQLIRYANLLSKGFPHVRVDLYIVKEKVYFGELTFTNGAGFDRIEPYAFDLELGSYLNLPDMEKINEKQYK